MNRVIKFRAWDYLTESMVPWLSLKFDKDEHDDDVCFYEQDSECSYVGGADYEIMQFTGLHDKNGVEIYEGDIIELHQFLFDGFGEVEKELKGVVVYQPGTCSFALDRVDNKNIKEYMGYEEDEEVGPLPIFLFYGLHEESFTVIGNRFEHPHLLEGM